MIQPIFIGNVAGLSHAKPDLEVLAASPGLHLIPEPTNEFDARAIRIVHPVAGKIGYIPRESVEAVHIAWANGFDTECLIREIVPGRYDKVFICVSISIS